MTEAIAELLARLEPPGAFATRLQASAAELELKVTGVGELAFPITASAAAKLRAVASLAPFGLREQTLHDPAVRNTWEIAASQLKLSKRWATALAGHLAAIEEQLGLPAGAGLRAELDKLLLYEQGQFFKPHQDSEKCDDMLGTLVVLLPSQYKGGTLTVEHGGARATFARVPAQSKQLSLLAFYADCQHQVSPVTSGVRVALTYRLVLAPSKREEELPRTAAPLVAPLAALIRKHFATPVAVRYGLGEPAPPRRLVYLLDHEYTQRSLTWGHLKRADRRRALALREVALQLDCECHLVLAEAHEIWNCEEEEYLTRSEWNQRRYQQELRADGELKDDETPALLDLCDSSIALLPGATTAGAPGEIATLAIENGELCLTRLSAELRPFRSEYEGYQGNYGNTVERWYHRAAVVMWPRSLAFLLQAEADPAWGLAQLLAQARGKQRAEAEARLRSLLPRWPGMVRAVSGAGFATKASQLAVRLGNPALAEQLLAPLGTAALSSPPFRRELVALVHAHGAPWAEVLFTAWAKREWQQPEWLAALPPLVAELIAGEHPAGTALAHWLVGREQAGALARLGLDQKAHLEIWLDLDAHAAEATRFAHVAAAAQQLSSARLAALADALFTAPRPPSTPLALQLLRAAMAHGPALHRGIAGTSLRRTCEAQLHALLTAPPRAPSDWSIHHPLACACADCAGLTRFLASDQDALDWPLAKDRRAHLHHKLDGAKLPVTHLTLRRGSPHVLQLRKHPSLFAREAAYRSKLQAMLTALQAAAPADAESVARPLAKTPPAKAQRRAAARRAPR